MEMTDVKLLAINGIALAITMTELEVSLKIILLLVTIGYTVFKWVKLKEKK
jgi:hypothetical protein|tara:strand:- start:442 stop:594 length:153 start_codon:yes stop_codon:yes gene_type:complete